MRWYCSLTSLSDSSARILSIVPHDVMTLKLTINIYSGECGPLRLMYLGVTNFNGHALFGQSFWILETLDSAGAPDRIIILTCNQALCWHLAQLSSITFLYAFAGKIIHSYWYLDNLGLFVATCLYNVFKANKHFYYLVIMSRTTESNKKNKNKCLIFNT